MSRDTQVENEKDVPPPAKDASPSASAHSSSSHNPKGKPEQPFESNSGTPDAAPKQPKGWLQGIKLPAGLQWIPKNWKWSNLKVVIRCSVAAWISGLLFVIPRVQVFMGQASFLVLITIFFAPPSDPFIVVFEREMLLLLLASTSWAWCCLGIFLANLARTNKNPAASFFDSVTGRYIEAGPSIILAVFIFLGTIFFLYIKARQGPGPYILATVFATLCLDICLTTAALFPFPYYTIGKALLLPLSFHSAICLLCSILIFPSSVSAQFTTRLQGVFTPLASAIASHRTALKSSTDSPEFRTAVSTITSLVRASEGALAPLAASGRFMKSDLVYDRFAPTDFSAMHDMARRIAVKANSMIIYFQVIDPERDKFPSTPAPSRPTSPVGSRAPSPDFPRTPRDDLDSAPATPLDTPAPSIRFRKNNSRAHTHANLLLHGHGHGHRRHNRVHSHHNHLYNSLVHLAVSRPPTTEPVGVFESQRYLNIEAVHTHPADEDLFTTQTNALLTTCCDELLGRAGESLTALVGWLDKLREGRFSIWKSGVEKKNLQKKKLENLQNVRADLTAALEQFREDGRHKVLEPYRPAFDPEADPSEDTPPYRYLFHCYVYQYHLMQFSGMLQKLLDEAIRLEQERGPNKLWTPVPRIFTWNTWQPTDSLEHNDDEDPDVIPGMEPAWVADLGLPRPRDPDVLPPTNLFQLVMNIAHNALAGLARGNVLFAIKAATLTVILCIPSFLKSSAQFAYVNRFIWAIFMGQLTIARFRGDTTFGLVSRLTSTFFGVVLGMVMWYISCGNGRGNPYGLAAVFAVCFPFFIYVRLYWPTNPLTSILLLVTAILVVGYSYQDLHILIPGAPGFGWQVAWRRFVLVVCGVVAAFLFSFLPPSTTIRLYQRRTLATTSSELGAIYCAIVSFANSRRDEDTQEIITSLIAIRSKLNRSLTMKANVIYEFSLRGRWPAERYHTILELQLQIAYSLSHLMSVVEQLEPAWSRAFLRRTRLLDSDFQGDVLAVISLMSTALRTGMPLPQITPCPLLDRFMVRHHGLNVIHQESEDDYGLPRNLTMDTLRGEQYQIFCVGVSTAFGIMTRLDRLMVATKEVVGEQYHIHGVGLDPFKTRGVDMGPRTSTLQSPPSRSQFV